MKRAMSVLLLTIFASPSIAAAETTPVNARVAAYDDCLMGAAVRASYTPAPNERIFDMARGACAKVRTRAVLGRADQRAALEASDADKAANLAEWVSSLRERRRSLDALYGAPQLSLR